MAKIKIEKPKIDLEVHIPRDALRSLIFSVAEQLEECKELRQSITSQMDVLEDVEHTIKQHLDLLSGALYGAKWWEVEKYKKKTAQDPEDEYFDEPPNEVNIAPAQEVQPAPQITPIQEAPVPQGQLNYAVQGQNAGAALLGQYAPYLGHAVYWENLFNPQGGQNNGQ